MTRVIGYGVFLINARPGVHLAVKPGPRIYSRAVVPLVSAAPNRRDHGAFSVLWKFEKWEKDIGGVSTSDCALTRVAP